MPAAKPAPARDRLLSAATRLFRAQGYAATGVDALCAEAGVTKGAFFHHFPSKEALGVAAATRWADIIASKFAGAPYLDAEDPLDRVLGYIDRRIAMLDGTIPAISCLVGTLVQEMHATSPAIRDACQRTIVGHVSTVEPDIAAAAERHGISGIDPASLARHIHAVIQGGFVLAKAADDATPARESLRHLRQYVQMLFQRSSSLGEAA